MAVRLPDTAADVVTVAEVQRVVLAGSRVAGGSAGLHRRVTWATSLRSRPPAYEPRGGGELVLASQGSLEGLRQVDASMTLERVLEGLAQAGAAALAVPGPIPAKARAAANEHTIPLIELPGQLSLLDAERGVIGLVLDRHNVLQTRASDFYRRLAQLSVEGRGVDAILEEAAAAAGRVVAFEDVAYRLRGVAVPPGAPVPEVDTAGVSSVEERGRLNEHVRTQPISSTTPAAVRLSAARLGLERFAAPVVTSQRVRGFVSFCGPADSLTEFDQLAASRAAAICALELAKEEAVLAAEHRVQRDLVDELLTPAADPESLARKALQAGLTEIGPFAVGVFALESTGGHMDRDLLLGAADAIGRRARQAELRTVTRVDAGELTVICDLSSARPVSPRSDGAAEAAEDAERRLRAAAAALFESATKDAVVLSAGFSRAQARLAGLPQAAIEARDALRIGRRVHGPGALVPYADLGLYRVLHAVRESPELRTFYEQTLGPLVEYDRRTGQNLIETLEVFFECHGNLSQTAQKMHLHRNSLLYRIGRIQEVSGLDLEDADARLSLQVALKARRLLT